MAISPGQAGRADDFINDSERDATPANDEGRVPKLENTGRLGDFFLGNPVKEVLFAAGPSLSVTTEADEMLLIWAKGETMGGNISTTSLSYDGVSKDQYEVDSGEHRGSFCLMSAETPGAKTANITVTSGGTIANVKIMAIRIKIT